MNANIRVVPFLRVRIVSLLAAMSLAAACWPPTLPAEDLRLVQLTDIHASRVDHNPQPRFPGDPMVNDLVHSLDILRAAVERINAELRPELVVITGDLVDRGDDLESLREVKTCLDRLTCPYYPVIGDHDRKATYQQVFPQRLDYAFDHRGWHLVALDCNSGRLSAESLKWLENDLSASRGRPTIVMLHRPLVANPLSTVFAKNLYGVRLTLENAPQALDLLRRHPDVSLVLSGHTHVSDQQRSEHISLLTTPALVVAPHCLRLIELSGRRVPVEPGLRLPCAEGFIPSHRETVRRRCSVAIGSSARACKPAPSRCLWCRCPAFGVEITRQAAAANGANLTGLSPQRADQTVNVGCGIAVDDALLRGMMVLRTHFALAIA